MREPKKLLLLWTSVVKAEALQEKYGMGLALWPHGLWVNKGGVGAQVSKSASPGPVNDM